MAWLERRHSRHAGAVLAFEVANRDYFAASIADRGDDYFERFGEHFAAAPAEQESGACAFFVLVDEGGAVLGRFNLYGIRDEAGAHLGYRVAQRVVGWPRRPSGSCARWRRPGWGCAGCGRPWPTRMSRRSGCWSRRASCRSGRLCREVSRAAGSSVKTVERGVSTTPEQRGSTIAAAGPSFVRSRAWIFSCR